MHFLLYNYLYFKVIIFLSIITIVIYHKITNQFDVHNLINNLIYFSIHYFMSLIIIIIILILIFVT